jgi:hypothetical protein
MPNKGNKCCCDECPQFCLNHAESLAPCGFQAAANYLISSFSASQIIGTGDQLLEPPVHFTRTLSKCVWESAEDPQWVLNLGSAGSGTGSGYVFLKYTSPDDGSEIIWVPRDTLSNPKCRDKYNRSYDPLCNSVFEYSPELSTPPTNASWYRCLCTRPAGGCCDSDDSTQPLPDTLFASISYCKDDNPGLQTIIEINWNSTERRWEGTGTASGMDWEILLYCEESCVGALQVGCGQGLAQPSKCYSAEINTDCTISGPMLFEDCQCEPFEADFIHDAGQTECCSPSGESLWTMTITE